MSHATLPCHWFRAPATVVAAILVLGAGPSAGAGAPALDPAQIGWQALEFRARKLFLAAGAEVAIGFAEGEAVVDGLITPAGPPGVPPGPQVVVMELATEGLGRRSDSEVLLDADSGAALQRRTHDSGSRPRYRIYRYTDAGAFHRTWWPEAGETGLPWREWSRREEGLRSFPAQRPPGPVTNPAALLYLVPAGPLFEPGDRLEVLTFARRHVHRVTAVVAEPRALPYDYVVEPGGDVRRGRGEPLRILLNGTSVDDGDDADEFELFGLSGDIELFLDPQTRAPLALAGRVKIVGGVTFRLERMTLR